MRLNFLKNFWFVIRPTKVPSIMTLVCRFGRSPNFRLDELTKSPRILFAGREMSSSMAACRNRQMNRIDPKGRRWKRKVLRTKRGENVEFVGWEEERIFAWRHYIANSL